MMFASLVVDGLVHQLGGAELAEECRPLNCPEGEAIVTGPGDSELAQQYRRIVHTVPPFYGLTDNTLLADCYQNALQAATELSSGGTGEEEVRVASPLLGGGCRGFPIEEAVGVAANSLKTWMENGTNESLATTLVFGIPSSEIRRQLVEAVEAKHGM